MQKDHLDKRNGDLMAALESNFQPQGTTPAIDASISDGAMFVSMLKPDASNTLDYTLKQFCHTFESQHQGCRLNCLCCQKSQGSD